MSNSYGIPDYILRQLAEQYLAGQEAPPPEEDLLGAPAPMLTGEQQNFAGMIPMYDLEGDPVSMTSMLNQLQDVNQLLADPLFQGGGGIGGWSQQAFQPTVNYEVVDSPEYQRWRNYINTPESFEGMIAAEIDGGGTPFSAIRKIQQRVTENPEGDIAKQLLTFFPTTDFDGLPTGEIDWTAASDAATQIDELRSQIPQIGGTGSITMPDGTVVPAGEIMEVDGQLVKRTEEPSELMEHFNELGLPSPFEQYTAASFLGPEWEAQNQAWQASAAGLEPLDAALRAAYEEMIGFQPTPGGARVAPGQREEEEREEEREVPEPAGRIYVPGGVSGLPQPVPVESPPEGASDTLLTAMSLGPGELTPYVVDHLSELTRNDLDALHDQVLTMASSGDLAWSQEMNDFLEALPRDPSILDEGGGNTGWTRGIRDFFEGQRGAPVELPTEPPLPELGRGQVGIAPTGGGGGAGGGAYPEVRGLMGPMRLGGGAPTGGRTKTIRRGEFSPEQTEAAMRRVLQGEPEPPSPAAIWPPTILYDPWAQQQATRESMEANLRQTPTAAPGSETAPWAAQPPTWERMEPWEPELPRDENLPSRRRRGGGGSFDRERRGGEGTFAPAPAPPWPPTIIYDPWASEQATRESMEANLRQTPTAPPQSELVREPPNPAAIWPPTTIYDPWAPRQATQESMRRNLAEPSPAAMWTPTIIYDPWQAHRVRAGEEEPRAERVVRTGEERARLARERAPRNLRGESYEPTTGVGTVGTGRRGRFRRAYQERSHFLVERQKAANQIYGRGSGFGEAMAAVYRAQLQGASPLQQVYAQRVQNVANAGIPIGAVPGLVSY